MTSPFHINGETEFLRIPLKDVDPTKMHQLQKQMQNHLGFTDLQQLELQFECLMGESWSQGWIALNADHCPLHMRCLA